MDEQHRNRLEDAYRSTGADLWRAIRAYAGGSGEIADEAVAETFAQAARSMPRIRDLRPWLYTTAFRIARGELKRRGERPDPQQPRIEPEHSEGEDVEGLRALVSGLSPNQRAVLVLRGVFGYSSRESAQLLGISETAVRVHLHAARRRARARLEKEMKG